MVSWRQVAACRKHGPAIMLLGERDAEALTVHPSGHCQPQEGSAAVDTLSTRDGRERARLAVTTCAGCPVAEDCLTDAIADGHDGLDDWSIRAGLLPNELTRLVQTMEHVATLGAVDTDDRAAVIERVVAGMRDRYGHGQG